MHCGRKRDPGPTDLDVSTTRVKARLPIAWLSVAQVGTSGCFRRCDDFDRFFLVALASKEGLDDCDWYDDALAQPHATNIARTHEFVERRAPDSDHSGGDGNAKGQPFSLVS